MKITQFFMVVFIILISSNLYSKSSEQDKISELEKKIDNIQETYLKNNTDIASAIASSKNMQEDLILIKGLIESNAHLINSKNQVVMNLVEDLEHRLQTIEDRIDLFSIQIMKALEIVAPKVANEGKLFQEALDKINESEYLTAAAKLQTFIKQYSKSELISKAYYWIGECFFSVRDYKRAIKEFQTFITKYPKNEKVPTAILKQGMGFYELGLVEQSKVFFEKIIKEYSLSKEATSAKDKLDLIKNKNNKPDITTTEDNGNSSYPIETIEETKEKPMEDKW